MATKGTIELFIWELSRAINNIIPLIKSPDNFHVWMEELGWDVPIPDANKFDDASEKLSQFLNALSQIDAEASSNEQIEKYYFLLEKAWDFIEAIKNVASIFQGAALPDGFVNEAPEQIFNYIIIKHLEFNHPALHSFLKLFGIIKIEEISNQAGRHDYFDQKLDLSKLIRVFSNPSDLLTTIYGCGTKEFDVKRFIDALAFFANGFGVPTYNQDFEKIHLISLYKDIDQYHLTDYKNLRIPFCSKSIEDVGFIEMGLAVLPLLDKNITNGNHLPEGIGIQPYVIGTAESEISLSENADLRLSGNINARLLCEIRKDGLTISSFSERGNYESFAGEATASLILKGSGEKLVLLGSAEGSRLETENMTFVLGILARENDFELKLECNLQGGSIVINAEKADGFVTGLLPSSDFNADFDFSIGWSSHYGLYFRGSSALEIHIPIHIDIGPIDLEGLTIAIKPQDGKLPITLEADVKATLGPLIAVIQNMGVIATFSFPPNHDGNVGPLQIDIGFQPPKGVGLSIDSGAIKGGGYLYFDAEKGEYMGALELDFQDMFSLKAIGIINTKLPDGSKGFSLLIIITADFQPIQLGFGFTLNAVGGLLALNRTTRIDVLREGIKTNALKSVLFPEDVVANINRIVSDLKQIFPPQEQHFIFGPMGKIGYGTPSIITLELGLLLEIPDPRIVILGILKALLPEENAPLLVLQVNFLGVIDFENKYISFDASLYDSRLLAYTLSGDMAFRLSWGDTPLFILSVGGFHPSFNEAPSDLQNMTRLTISLLSGENPRISIQCYFAVTSNTVQFGAMAELYAEACGFNVYGFVGFDVLFQFNPFHFMALIFAGLAVRRGSDVLMSIKLVGGLLGPSPWDVRGEASFSILFFDVTVSFHETWGDRIEKIEPERVDIFALLTGEVYDSRNWTAEIPDKNNLHVTIKKIESNKEIPLKIDRGRFENAVLNRLEEVDQQFISGKYDKNEREDCYVLVDSIDDANKEKIKDLLSKVDFYNLIVHPFGVLTFSERLVPLGITLDRFGSKVPKDITRFELTEIESNSTRLQTQDAMEQFARSNFFDMSDSDKLSHPSFDQLTSGFKIVASAGLRIGTAVSKSVDYELTYLRKERFSLVREGIYKLAKGLFKAATKGSAVSKSPLSDQNNRISKNAPIAVEVLPETYGIASTNDLKLYGPDMVANSYTEAAELYRDLINKQPELKGQIQILSQYELNRN